jgi:hypothetical protein
MPLSDRPADVYGFAPAGKHLALDLRDGLDGVRAHVRSGARQLIDTTTVAACRQPLAAFGVALIIAAILTRSAWRPAAES